jgi:predicted nucleic acid-binding protein
MKMVFADTYYFLALLNKSDKGHQRAVQFTKDYKGGMVTTGWVMTELADAMAVSPSGRTQFVQTWKGFRTKAGAQMVPCTDALQEEGISFYSRRADKDWSLTDCISFVVMQREGITEALTADHHFEQAGFVALLK